MHIYLAGEVEMTPLLPHTNAAGEEVQPKLLNDVIRRRLYSYFYHQDQGGVLDKTVRESIAHNHMLFLDSGAYSAFTQKKEVSLRAYGNFCLRHQDKFNFVANLDDIGDDGPKSWENFERLRGGGARVSPVFHDGDKYEYLERMLDDPTITYMALGGLVGTSIGALKTWLDYVWGNFLTNKDGTPRVKCHAFGMTSYELLKRYPFYSADSASWVFTSNVGDCSFLMGDKLVNISFTKGSPAARNGNGWHYDNMPPIIQQHVDKKIAEFGMTAEQLSEHYGYRRVINAATFAEMEDNLNVTKFVKEQEGLFG